MNPHGLSPTRFQGVSVYQFRHTVYEEARIPLRHWAYAFWRACTSKKSVSALELSRQCEISYKSALFLMNRIRFAMALDFASAPKLL